MPTEPLTMSVPAAGRLIGLGVNASYRAAKAGTIPVLRIGKRLLVPREALEKMLKEAPYTRQ